MWCYILISVVVPVYKVEDYLSRCIDSILAQTFTDFELILVDDGSPDNCGEICERYAEKDDRIKVIHQMNGGLSSARNTGIEWALKNSESEWITFIDSDDWIHPRYLELLYRANIENNTSVSICGFIRTEQDEPYISEEKFISVETSTQDFFINNNVNAVTAWGKLYKISDFKDIRYPNGKLHEDEFTTHKILFKYEKFSFIEAEMYYYYTNPVGIMNSTWSAKRLDVIDAVKSQCEFFKEKNLTKIYDFCVKKYILCLDNQIKNIAKSNDSKLIKTYMPKLKKELRRYLHKQNKNERFTIKEDPWIYESAYPYFMNLYWKIRCVNDKIRK